MTRHAPHSRAQLDQRGAALLGSVVGLGIVLTVLGFAVNVSLGLWTRTTVDAVAYDAARDVATAPAHSDRSAVALEAIRRARSALGPYGQRVELRFESLDGETVTLRVRAPGVSLLPRMLDVGPMVGSVDERITVRVESP